MKYLALILFLSGTTLAQVPSADTLQRIDQLFTRWNNATPGGAVTVERNGKIIYNKAFGLADLEHNVPNTTETIFEGGSLSKQFTATAVLLLVNDGKLSLEDNVRKFVPELPDYGMPITIQHLINHTSGLKDWGTIGAVGGWPRATRVYTQEMALEIICRQRSLNFKPGSEYSYSNSNYTLLVTIVERITNQTLAAFTRARVFEPAGMTHTQWRDNFREVIPNRSVAYGRSQGTYFQNMPFENVYGHGGILTTTGDLIAWNRQLEKHEIGGDRLFQQRVKKGKLSGGREITYAAGLVIGNLNGFQEISHTGATAGYRAVLSYFPAKKLSIAILSNDATFNPGAATEIAEVFLGKREPAKQLSVNVPIPDEKLRRFEGTYRSIRNFDVFNLVYSQKGISFREKAVSVLHPDTLYQGNLRWIAKGNGQILLKNQSDTATYIRVKQSATDASYLKSLTGEYHSDDADVTYFIELRGNELWVNRKLLPAYKLDPSFYDGFMSDGVDLHEFKRTKKGAVDRFELSTARAERLIFYRKSQ